MTSREIRAELILKGVTLLKIYEDLGGSPSYHTIQETISGTKRNPLVLKYLNDLGIDHGRVFGKLLVSFEDGSKKMVEYKGDEAA